MGRFVKQALISAVAFGLPMGLMWTLMFRNLSGMAAGLVAGVLFGLVMAGFAAILGAKFARQNPCVGEERLLKQGPANLFRGWEGVGGWLYLTDERLIFRPHRFNIQKREDTRYNIKKDELSIPLTEIAGSGAYAVAGVLPTGLRVAASRGEWKFVVEGRNDWVEEIEEARRFHS